MLCHAFSDFGASWLDFDMYRCCFLDCAVTACCCFFVVYFDTHSLFMVSLKIHTLLSRHEINIHHQSSSYIQIYPSIFIRYLSDIHCEMEYFPCFHPQIMSAVETKSPGVFTRGVREKFSSVGDPNSSMFRNG